MLISQSEIIDIFKSCGFEKVGIASPQIAEIYKRAIEQWAKNKQHGTMQWFENNLEKRTNPHVLESWVKSIVVVAKNYYPGRANENKNGKTSNYAWGKDYHKILKTQLKTAIEKIKILCPQIKTRAFVDSAPVMERTLATQSGLGFIGKNTMLITEEFGSWVFLGTVFTNLELSPTAPENKFNYCGTCAACIDACPTDALKPFSLDARKCISYQTIEKKGKIDVDLNGWSFGCDICQEVCPWNRFEKITNEIKFSPNQQKTLKNKYSEAEFFDEFAETPVFRAGFQKLNQSIVFNRKKS